jgi:glyoxylase-like metal-dependent hydrolase (beta-lactamase superfamily II)
MRIRSFAVGPFQENAYLVIDETTNHAVLIDPGDEASRLLAAVAESDAVLDAIWITHGHMDHVGAVAAIERALPVPVHVHPGDLPLYRAAAEHGLMFGATIEQPPEPDMTLADGQVLRVGSLAFTVMHAPGHSPGHVVIHGNGVAFVGDCLFAGSIGRTDLPLASGAQLGQSLARIAALADDTVVYSGHGPATTIARERAENPFLNGLARVAAGR